MYGLEKKRKKRREKKERDKRSSFFFNDTATTEIYTLSLHDALPIFQDALVTPVDAATTENRTPDDKEEQGELAPQQSQGIFSKLKNRLSRTRTNLTTGLSDLVLGKKEIDQEILDDIETLLLVADVGVEATNTIISNLTERVARKQLHDADALFSALRENMANLLKPCNQPLVVPESDSPFIILMLGKIGRASCRERV